MDTSMLPIQTASEVFRDFDGIVESARENHQPLLVKGARGNAVLVSEDDWQAIQETLYLMSIPGMRESILESRATPLAECSETIEW
jgi:antitoxin YefM